MPKPSPRSPLLPLLLVLSLFGIGAGYIASQPQVGPVQGGGFTVATGQRVRPSGDTLSYNGRPVDMVAAPDGKTLYLKDEKGLVCIDATTWKVLQTIPFPKGEGSSLHGLRVSRDGKTIWATSSGSLLWVAHVDTEGTITLERSFALPGPKEATGNSASYPCGIAVAPDEKTLYVCLSRKNVLAVVDAATGTILKEIPTAIAPYAVVLTPNGKGAWVSNWGGRIARQGERTASSSGTEVPVDVRGVAVSGSVSLVDLTEGKELTQIETGLHASDLVLSPGGDTLYVANANQDTVSIINTANHRLRANVLVKPDAALPFGSMPNALALSQDGKTLYVACAGNNAIAVIALSPTKKPTITGWIPTAWYPGALILQAQKLYIACVKGFGSRFVDEKESAKGRSVYSFSGTVSRVPLMALSSHLATYTKQVIADSRVPEALRSQERQRSGRKPVAIPERPGEPSVFEHVVYIIKENRTYDQVLGDLKQGNGDPNLCLYGREITPNHHALAEQFVLLDNFYCNGVNSADGHSWVTEGNVTDHLEKAFGGFTRSYTFGDDPLTYSYSGFIWDNVLAHGLSFRNWGEMAYTDEKPDVSYAAVFQDWQNKTNKINFTSKIGIERLKQYSAKDAVGWNMDVPDVLRADLFLRDLAKYEKSGNLPNFCIVYLPNDHTTGTTPGDPTPRSYLADNDLALGRVIAGISRSRFWSKTCVFVIEDDPQAGFDHVDGHRSLCLVASPYTRRGVVDHHFYNQTSVIHTMESMLGLPTMNQRDAGSSLMATCFQEKPNLQPYTCLPARVPLAELNPPTKALTAPARYWAKKSLAMDFRDVDDVDEDTLNRVLWHNAKGINVPYPVRFVKARTFK